MRDMKRWIVAVVLLATVVGPRVSVAAQEAAQESGALSPRNANYEIEVTLDPEGKMLEGRQVLTWRNIQETPTDELWFHLYWNAWRNNRSTWLLEDKNYRRRAYGRDIPKEDWGYCIIESIRLLPEYGYRETDLKETMRFVSPDDGNPEDRTVMVVQLPVPVGPGETVQVELTWKAKIPRTFHRTGFRGNFYFLAHWFPKLGVFEEGGWNGHQFHAPTEFYSDYGVYDVRMTVPEDYVVGATGRETEQQTHPDGTTTHRYQQADVHAFTWTTSPDYIELEDRFDEKGLPPVEMRLLIQPEHLDQAQRHFDATKACLRHYGSWYGPYPYGHITIIDPAYGSGARGMEYPTLFTCGTRLFNPFGGGAPEMVTVHECGHQFWYGIVGNNEFEHAWLDEGFNSFSHARTMDVAYGPEMLVRRYLELPRTRGGFIPVLFEDLKETRWVGGNGLDRYRPFATWDPLATPSYLYFPSASHPLSYQKTALWLSTLERVLGWETLQRILSTFFERWRFRHPKPEDFFDVVNEVTGEDLGWFFDQVYRSAADFDYAVESVSSESIQTRGFVDSDDGLEFVKPEPEAETYRTEVVVRRLGSGVFPVEVLMVFEDGTEVRHTWDGQYPWKMFVEEKPVKLDYAVVDPERILLLDLYYTNNSRRLEPDSRLASWKWASKWMVWLQDLLSMFSFFV